MAWLSSHNHIHAVRAWTDSSGAEYIRVTIKRGHDVAEAGCRYDARVPAGWTAAHRTRHSGPLKHWLVLMEFRDRRVERAHKRYLAAIKAFAQVRRLQLPPVAQLNMAQQQVNITEVAQPDQG